MKWYDRLFGETRIETSSYKEDGDTIVTVTKYKGKTPIYRSVTTYYAGLSINL